MKIIFTGTPGTGKSSAAKWLAQKMGWPLINEKQHCLEHKIGRFEEEELIIPLPELKKSLQKELKSRKNAVLEGHLLCEIKLPVDLVFVITMDPERLQAVLEARGYSAEKIQDNVFCEGIDYCKKHALRNYGKKVVEVRNEKTFKELQNQILKHLKKKGLKK